MWRGRRPEVRFWLFYSCKQQCAVQISKTLVSITLLLSICSFCLYMVSSNDDSDISSFFQMSSFRLFGLKKNKSSLLAPPYNLQSEPN